MNYENIIEVDILQEWKLESTTGEPVTLTFEAFNTGDCVSECDSVEINDGTTTQTFNSTSIPGPVTATTITVKFSSDDSVARTGFLATVCCSANITTGVTGEQQIEANILIWRVYSDCLRGKLEANNQL